MITWTLNTWGRVVDRVRTGTWCQHEGRWGPWHMVDLGREKIRYCDRCGWMQTTNHPWRGLLAGLRVRLRVRSARHWARKHVKVISTPWLKDQLWKHGTEPKE